MLTQEKILSLYDKNLIYSYVYNENNEILLYKYTL